MKKNIIFAMLFTAGCQKWNSISVTYQRIKGADKHEPGHAFFCDADSADYKGFDTVTKYFNNPEETKHLPRPDVTNTDTGRLYFWYNKILFIK